MEYKRLFMKYAYLFFIAVALCFVSSCKDDEATVDPCVALKATSADFYIYPSLGIAPHEGWKDLDSDTILYQLGATFKAKYKADKFTWLIGSEILEDSVVFRTNFPQDENITVTLIAEKFTPVIDCFPNDTGRDTFSRTFFSTATVAKKFRWEGEFIGRYDFLPDEEHKFTIGLDSFFVYGLPYDECQHRLNILNSSFNSVLFEAYDVLDQTGRCSQSMKAFMTVDQDSFWLDVIGPESNTELNGHSMKGIKLN